MRSFRCYSCILPVFLLVLCTSPALAQQGTSENFQPTVGQDGKDVVWVPTPQELVDTMLDMAKVTSSDFVMDLGSGDGRTVITAAKRGAKAVGIEYNPEMVALSKRNAAAAGVSDKATFKEADLFETDFSQATVITMFLLNSINMKLRPTLLELKPGTRLVSNTFTMGDWIPDSTKTIDEATASWRTAMLWIVPAKVGGTWKMPQGELSLTQEFQMLNGTLKEGSGSVSIENGKMNGYGIVFNAGKAHYTGKVNGNTIEGTYTIDGKSNTWKATKVTSN